MNREWPRIALGGGVILVGVLLLLASLGVYSYTSLLTWMWPVGLILAGFAFMARQYGVGSLLVVLAFVAGGFVWTAPFMDVPGSTAVYAYDVPANNASRLGVDLSYVGGDLTISSAQQPELLRLSARDYWEPDARTFVEENQTVVKLERGFAEPRFGEGAVWNLTLGNASSMLAMDLVAVDGELDLRGVALEELVISNVASDLSVRLPVANASVSVDSTASDVQIVYPAGVGVLVQYDAVASQVKPLGDFTVGNGYRTQGYANATTKLTVSISAVASDVQIVQEE